jgi:hypothetical protein
VSDSNNGLVRVSAMAWLYDTLSVLIMFTLDLHHQTHQNEDEKLSNCN